MGHGAVVLGRRTKGAALAHVVNSDSLTKRPVLKDCAEMLGGPRHELDHSWPRLNRNPSYIEVTSAPACPLLSPVPDWLYVKVEPSSRLVPKSMGTLATLPSARRSAGEPKSSTLSMAGDHSDLSTRSPNGLRFVVRACVCAWFGVGVRVPVVPHTAASVRCPNKVDTRHTPHQTITHRARKGHGAGGKGQHVTC